MSDFNLNTGFKKISFFQFIILLYYMLDWKRFSFVDWVKSMKAQIVWLMMKPKIEYMAGLTLYQVL